MWAWCEKAFPGAVQVLDLWHALQHLKEALDCAYGDGTAEAMHRFENLREILKEDPDWINEVVRSLRYLARKNPGRKTISRVLAFFRSQRHRMKYAEVLERGMPVGSGTVEAANKALIKSRMKGAGMRWAEYRYRAADPDFPGTLVIRPLRCRMATTLPSTAAAGVPIPGPQTRKDIENGNLSQITH